MAVFAGVFAGVAAFAGAAAFSLAAGCETGADLLAGRGAGFFTTVEGLAAGAGAALAGAGLAGALAGAALVALAGAGLAGRVLAGAGFFAAGAGFLAGVLVAAGFFATGFLAGATCLAAGFFATGFLAGAVLAAGFFAAGFGAALAAGFLVALAAFFAGFFAATSGVSSIPSNELHELSRKFAEAALQSVRSAKVGSWLEKAMRLSSALQHDPASDYSGKSVSGKRAVIPCPGYRGNRAFDRGFPLLNMRRMAQFMR